MNEKIKKTRAFLAKGICFGYVAALIGTDIHRTGQSLADLVTQKKREAIERVATSAGFVRPRAPLSSESIDRTIVRAAIMQGVSPALARAVAKTESAFRHDAVSPKGALGVMQVMPANAKRCGLRVAELLHPVRNIECGVGILSDDLAATGNDPIKALRRYNGGPKCQNGGCKESDAYAAQVLRIAARDIG